MSAHQITVNSPKAYAWCVLTSILILFPTIIRLNAADITVANTAENGPGSLREALLAAQDGDAIWLPFSGVFPLSTIYDDADNFMGPTATPLITKKIYIEANGSSIERADNAPRMRAFAIGEGGDLILRNAHIRGFRVKGGDGATGGGGGMGAGGAIYVYRGKLTIESCTFEANGAVAGNGSSGSSGGGGGLGGNGGEGVEETYWGGGGGGGARGAGARAFVGGGGGGGTLSDGNQNQGGFKGGGDGGDGYGILFPDSGDNGNGGGGGGGGMSSDQLESPISGDGGKGGYGGGGGGGGYPTGDGGNGGFGGGGGGGGVTTFGDAGKGGFGGGGGANGVEASDQGLGGYGAGNGAYRAGGGGAGFGGAIFNHRGTVLVFNSTFAGNFVRPGAAGGSGAEDGGAAGGALFSLNGVLRIFNVTISGNQILDTAGAPNPGGTGGGIFVMRLFEAFDFLDTPPPAEFTLRNTIIANNGSNESVAYSIFLAPLTLAGSGNLIQKNSVDFPSPGVVETADPQLHPLTLNSPGVTKTMAIDANSPAYNAGDANHCQDYDQRRVARAGHAPCDIGAFEAGNNPPFAICLGGPFPAGPDCTADVSIDGGSYEFDPGDSIVEITQSPAGPYPLGSTFVELAVKDSVGEVSYCYATIFVIDYTPPVLGPCPADKTVNATSPAGAVVTYTPPTLTDDCSHPVGKCSPASGDIFPVGTTVVLCNAVAEYTHSECTFNVTVKGAAGQIIDLTAKVNGLPDVKAATKNALVVKLNAASAALKVNDTTTACAREQDFINLVGSPGTELEFAL